MNVHSTVKHDTRSIYIFFRNNNTISKFSQYLLENGHTFGKIDDVLDIEHLARKSARMDTMETFLYTKKLKRIINRMIKTLFLIAKSLA
jgi:hypothetical protein